MSENPSNKRLTKRIVVERSSESATPKTDRELIDEELQMFKTEFPEGVPEGPWKGSLRLDKDDWILRQLFEKAGCDPDKRGHWRLLLGVLAEFYVDPDAPDNYERKYTPAALNAHSWTEEELDRLFDEASEVAKAHPKWSRPKICEELIARKRFVPPHRKDPHEKYKSSTLVKNLITVLASKKEDLNSGRLDADPSRKTTTELKLSYFKFNQTS